MRVHEIDDLVGIYEEDGSVKCRDCMNPDGHFKIPHLWPGQNPPPPYGCPIEKPAHGKGKIFSDRTSIILFFLLP
jgi:hypothetical protein